MNYFFFFFNNGNFRQMIISLALSVIPNKPFTVVVCANEVRSDLWIDSNPESHREKSRRTGFFFLAQSDPRCFRDVTRGASTCLSSGNLNPCTLGLSRRVLRTRARDRNRLISVMRGRSREKITSCERKAVQRLGVSFFRETSGAAGYRFSRARNLQPWHKCPRRFGESDFDDGEAARPRGLNSFRA